MLVYVKNKNGQPLMPTDRCGRIRHLLKEGKATIISYCPFTIKLCYECTDHTQPVSLGVDAGSKTVGLSATTETKVLYEAEVTLRDDITELLSQRRTLRRARRNRKTRYRKPRFLHRVHSKHKGYLAPSVENKIQTHLDSIARIRKFLPISEIRVETAGFDIQKIKNPEIEGKEYQEGNQLGFWNVREYVLFRDGHECQCCHGKSKDSILNVHHIESRETGGNAPNNLITLCETCHKGYHAGKVKLPESIHRGMSFRDAAFMGIMRWAFYDRLKETAGIPVQMTYGYITKHTRIANELPKEHYIDARCISGHPGAKPDEVVYYQKKVRCHNRQIHKLTIGKGGNRKRNQAAYNIKGFRLNDTVMANNEEWYIHGKRTNGAFVLKKLTGEKLEITPTKIKLKSISKHYITERRAV